MPRTSPSRPYWAVAINGHSCPSVGGLVHQTGAVQPVDHLLAIDGHCLRGRPLSAAVHLLEAAADTVALTIARLKPVS